MEETIDKINISNLDLYKSQSKSYKKALNAIFFTCLRELPKELLIEGLKKKKVIKQDWEKKGKQYSEYVQSTKKPEVVILDDNPLSMACYAEEYPENFEAITSNLNKESSDGK